MKTQSSPLPVDQTAPASQGASVRAAGLIPIQPGVLPNDLQLVLFRAIFCADADFEACWQTLKQALATSDLDPMSAQFLPLLHRRLPANRADALSTMVRTRYRQTWATNQLIFTSLRSSLRTLHAAGIPTLLLKGAALAATCYRDMGSRAMGDFDLLVPLDDFNAAATRLIADGWAPAHPLDGFDPRFAHALTMTDARGSSLDLHVHVLHFTPARDADLLFWQASTPIRAQEIETRGLCPADLVVHLAVHGFRWSPAPQLRWIPDISYTLAQQEMDWDRLLFITARLHTSIAVITALEYLVEQGFAAVPDSVLAALHAIPAGHRERQIFKLNSSDTFSSLLNTARFHWYIMTQQDGDSSVLQKLRQLSPYLSHRMKTLGFQNWSGLLGAGVLRHLKSKFGRYERTPTGQRLR